MGGPMRPALIGPPGPDDLPNTMVRVTGTEGVWGCGVPGPSVVGLVRARTRVTCTNCQGQGSQNPQNNWPLPNRSLPSKKKELINIACTLIYTKSCFLQEFH